MSLAIDYVKKVAGVIPHEWDIHTVRENLTWRTNHFIQDRILKARSTLMEHGVGKLKKVSVVLTYGRSSVVEMLLLKAHSLKMGISVVVVANDSAEGAQMVSELASHGMQCTLVMLSAISFVLSEVDMVMVGASALFSNGTMLAAAGTATVCMMAHQASIPVLVMAQTYKFSRRVQLDSIVFNEVADPDELIQGPKDPVWEWRDVPNLILLNIVYDLTPSEFIDMVVTEIGCLPSSSVPVIVRETEKHDYNTFQSETFRSGEVPK